MEPTEPIIAAADETAVIAREVEALLTKRGYTLVAEPSFINDGRGAWLLTTRVRIIKIMP